MTSTLPRPTNLQGGPWTPTTAIPRAIRTWGYVPDFTTWHPGDLVLTRPFKPDWISIQIQKLQELGYGSEFGSWTHASIYLGDGLTLCEAQIDPAEGIFDVIVAKIWEYLGTHEILLKRSRHALQKELGWAIATAAATKIGSEYDWRFVLKMACDRLFLGDAIWQQDQTGKISPRAFVCSSLYSTAHAYVTDISITDRTNGLCVPAYLAAQHYHLTTVEFPWRTIA
jgi:hypothetical protein